MKKKLTLAPLVAATYFMVAGGPYGLEELLRDLGKGEHGFWGTEVPEGKISLKDYLKSCCR